MSDLDHAKLADQFDELASVLSKIAGTFRASSDAEDAPAAPSKPAKPSKGKAVAAEVETEDTEGGVDIDDVREALKELATARGKDVMLEALQAFGAEKLADIEESDFEGVIAKAKELNVEPEEAPAVKKPAAKGKKKAGPTLEEVQAAARALIDADKAAYNKLAKKLGKPSEMEEGDYAAAIEAYEAAMPSDAADEEDEDL